MKLSTAAVIIAAGTSNVSSPNVVLAGKAGKLAPKASKAKAKAVKAHPSLSYGSGSGSYSMSIGPSPPPCPCWSQSALTAVTADNVVEPGDESCVAFPTNPKTLDLLYEIDGKSNNRFAVSPAYDGPGAGGPGTYECTIENDGKTTATKISEEEYESCFQDIEGRCLEIGHPVTSGDCPCFDVQDLLVVTSGNVDADSCKPSDNPFTLSSSTVSFGVEDTEPASCSKVYGGNGGAIAKLGLSESEETSCLLLLAFRCEELGLLPPARDNVGEGAMLSKMLDVDV